MKVYKLIFVMFISLVYSAYGNATGCTLDGGSPVWNATASLGGITVQRDTPVGSIIKTIILTPPAGKEVDCSSNAVRYRTLTYNGGVMSSIPGVYNTNLAGVGIQLPDAAFSNPSDTYYFTSSAYYNHHDVTINIIKTGNVTSGTLMTGEIGNEKFDGQTAGTYLTTEIISMGTGASVTQVVCSISTPSISVNLGNVSASDFTSTGSTPKSADFNVGLECDAGANINVSMSGTQSSESSDSSVLALTGAGGADVASGVGVQIVYDGTPLKLNNNIKLKSSAGGQELLPFTARYYQTKSDVKPGSANATATLNITYQ